MADACCWCLEPVHAWNERWRCIICPWGSTHFCWECASQRVAQRAPLALRPYDQAEAARSAASARPAGPCTVSAHPLEPVVHESGWLCYQAQAVERGDAATPSFQGERDRLAAFLTAYPPTAPAAAGVAWICVQSSGRERRAGRPADSMAAMEAAWGILPNKTKEAALNLAGHYGCLSGKWMVFGGPASIGAVWAAVAQAVVLPAPAAIPALENFVSAKVSGAPQQGTAHVICAYTADALDAEDVKAAGKALAAALVEAVPGLAGKTISYKPDVYTHLGIYTGNPWGIKPTLFTQKLPAAPQL